LDTYPRYYSQWWHRPDPKVFEVPAFCPL
jgi:hypothetical protein